LQHQLTGAGVRLPAWRAPPLCGNSPAYAALYAFISMRRHGCAPAYAYASTANHQHLAWRYLAGPLGVRNGPVSGNMKAIGDVHRSDFALPWLASQITQLDQP